MAESQPPEVADLTDEQKLSVLTQAVPAMQRRGMAQAVVRYSLDTSKVLTMEPTDTYDPESGEYHPQMSFDERYDPMQPFMVIPRLRELQNWMVWSDKSTNIMLYNYDGLVQNLTAMMTAMSVGDGSKVTILEEDLKSEDEELTKLCRDWSRHAGGKGKSMDGYVVPWWIIDNVTTGYSVFAKYIGQPDDYMVDPGDMALVHLDPRLYAPVGHDDRLFRKIVVYPIRQMLLPKNYKEFEEFIPSFRGPYSPYTSAGMTVFEKPVQLLHGTYYDCTLFQGLAPMTAIASECISTLEMRFYRNHAYEKFAFPIVLLRVARSTERDADDTAWMAKLGQISKVGAEIRNGDAVAVEGREYDTDGKTLSEGWEVSTLDTKSQLLDFSTAFRLIDEQKALGLRMSMSLLTNSGIEGQRHSMTAGMNIDANVGMTAKTIRAHLRDRETQVYIDYIFLKTGRIVKEEQIDIQFSEIRENDIAAYSGVVFQSFDRSLIDFEEARQHLRKVGLNLEHKSNDEMLQVMEEKQMAQAKVQMEMQKQQMEAQQAQQAEQQGEQQGVEEEAMPPQKRGSGVRSRTADRAGYEKASSKYV